MNVSLKLLINSRSAGPSTFLLRTGSTLIGRNPNCSLHLDYPSLSRWHCIIDIAPNSVFITDLHSLNGTYVNNRQAIRQPLQSADILRLGELSFLVRIDSSSDVPVSQAPSVRPMLPGSSFATKAQRPPLPPAASVLAALLPSPVHQGLAVVPPTPRLPQQRSYPLSHSAGQLARYEEPLIACTAKLRLLTGKLAALESRIDAMVGPDQAPQPKHSPKKAFESHDALMYIARAAIHEKVRRQNLSPSLPPKS